jgi:2-polyprenyl-6-methoxyphenol hydroxylase-like FAD-dependent oxidoreductase
MPSPFVIIVGGGPSGILLAILLGKQGISVQLLEAAEKFDDRPRATHYGPAAVRELQRAGVFEDMKAKGSFFPSGVCWRKLHGEVLATIPGPTGKEKHPLTCLPLNQLHEVLEGHLKNYPNIEVLFNHQVVSTGQDKATSWVVAETPDGKKTFNAQYVVGCDGANSIIRRTLFTDAGFEGFTWKEQIVATNVRHLLLTHEIVSSDSLKPGLLSLRETRSRH